MALKVLLFERDSSDPNSIQSDLTDRGHDVVIAHDSDKAMSIATATWPDLIIVNPCAGQLDVDEICQALAETQLEFPYLLISHDEMYNHIEADAHLAIPFTTRKLAHRINKAIGTQSERFLRAGDVTLDQMKHLVKRNDDISHLTPKEFKLLHLLMQHAGTAVNRRKIMNDVWETDYLEDTRTLDVHIRWLREKLEDNPSRPQHIITIRGVGYRFHVREETK